MNQTKLKEYVTYDAALGNLYWNVATGSSAIGKLITGISSDGRYKRVTIEGVEYSQHRLIWLYMTGVFPEYVDHINGNSLDNTWKNLREVTHQENLCNRKQLKSNTSGVTGVAWDKSRNKWKVQLAGKHLGRFENFEDAVTCRNAAVKANPMYTDRHGQKE